MYDDRQGRRGGCQEVTRTALQNAACIAGLLLTTECMVTEIPEKEKKAPMPGGWRRYGRHGRLLSPSSEGRNSERQTLKRERFREERAREVGCPQPLFCTPDRTQRLWG